MKKYLVFLPITISICINLYIYYTMPKDHKMMNDEREYESIALSILEGKGTTDFYYNEYSIDHRDIGLLITPVYSSFIALVYAVCGHNPFYVFLVQVVFNLLILFLFYSVLLRYTSEFFACCITCLLSLYWPLWIYNFTLMMEIPSILFLMLIIWSTDRYFRTGSGRRFYLISVLWGFLIFMNNRFIVFYGFFILLLFIQSRKILNMSIKKLVISVSIVILLLIPWHVRQLIVYGEPIIFTPLRSQSILNKELVKSITLGVNNELTKFPDFAEFTEIYCARPQFQDNQSKMNSGTIVEDYNRIKTNWEKRNPLWYHRFLENFRVFRTKFDIRRGTGVIRFTDSYGLKMNVLNALTLLPLLILMPLGIYFSVRRGRLLFQLIGVLYLSNIILLMLYDLVVERYTYLVLPLVFWIGAYGLWELWSIFSISFKRNVNQIS